MRARLLAAAFLVAFAPNAHAVAYGTKPQARLQAMWDAYGNAGTGDRWTGGSLDQTVALPDGRTVWVFGRTFLGTVRKDRSRDAATPTVANAYVLQDKKNGRLGATLLGPGKTALFTPTEPGHFYEPGAAVVEGGKLYQLLLLMADQSYPVRVDVATLALPSLKVESIAPMRYVDYAPTAQADFQAFHPVWGSAIVSDAKYHYVYGYENTYLGFTGYAHVSRVPRGQLATALPEYWDGSAWAPVPVTSKRVLGGTQLGWRSFNVTRTATGYRAITQGHTQDTLYVWTAPAPTGPWTFAVLYKVKPEATQTAVGFGPANYSPTPLPQYETKGSKVVFAYLDDGGPDRTSNVKKFRPVFVEATAG